MKASGYEAEELSPGKYRAREVDMAIDLYDSVDEVLPLVESELHDTESCWCFEELDRVRRGLPRLVKALTTQECAKCKGRQRVPTKRTKRGYSYARGYHDVPVTIRCSACKGNGRVKREATT